MVNRVDLRSSETLGDMCRSNGLDVKSVTNEGFTLETIYESRYQK